MKARDIVVNRKYAVGHPDYPREALVVKVEEHTKLVYDSGSFIGHRSNPTKMVAVRFKDTQSGEEEWFFPQQVIRPWAEQEEIAQRATDRRNREQSDYEARCRRAARIRERLIGMVDDAHATYAVDAHSGKVTLTFDEFAAVVGEDL